MPPFSMRRESLGKPSPGIGEGSPRQAGKKTPEPNPKGLGQPPGLVVKGWWVRAQLDHCPGISFHVAVCPAGAEIDVFPIILVLVNDLVRVGLAGITAGVDLFALAVPATANWDEIVSPSLWTH